MIGRIAWNSTTIPRVLFFLHIRKQALHALVLLWEREISEDFAALAAYCASSEAVSLSDDFFLTLFCITFGNKKARGQRAASKSPMAFWEALILFLTLLYGPIPKMGKKGHCLRIFARLLFVEPELMDHLHTEMRPPTGRMFSFAFSDCVRFHHFVLTCAVNSWSVMLKEHDFGQFADIVLLPFCNLAPTPWTLAKQANITQERKAHES